MRFKNITVSLCVCAGCGLLLASPAQAHKLEPISTEYALPFEPRAGTWQVLYEFELENGGATEQSLPEQELELGLFPRLQVNVGFPLLRINEGLGEPAPVVGGHLELGARTLLVGGDGLPYAVSLQTTVEAPTGSRRVVGDATELGAAIFVDRYLGRRALFHSNLGWGIGVGGHQPRERVFSYHNAVVWMASFHWDPVVELLGETDTATGETLLAAQPEMIYHVSRHLEFKVGLPVGLTRATPDIGVRAKISILWGD